MNKEVFPFFNRIAELYSNKLPFVVYRKPNEELVSLITQNEPIVYELTNFKESGFVFVPFHNTGKKVIFPIEKSSLFHSKISQYDDLFINEKQLKYKSGFNFDLAKQTKQFDPNEDYINRWDANKAVLSIDSRDAADWPIS